MKKKETERSGHEDRWSPNATRPSLLMLRTHRHTPGEQKSPSPVPAPRQMAHLFGPSAQRDAQLALPTDRRPSSAQVPWQAGGQAGASPRPRSNSHFPLVSLCCHPKEKKAPVNPTDQELSRSKTVTCNPPVSTGGAPRFCRSKRARGLQDGGSRRFYLQWSDWRSRSSQDSGTYARGEMIHRSLRRCVTSLPRLGKQQFSVTAGEVQGLVCRCSLVLSGSSGSSSGNSMTSRLTSFQ